MNKKSTLVTFASAAVLLGLFNINNSLTVKADTVEQPAVGQRNTQAATTNDQNNKPDQNQAQTNQNNDVATDQAQGQTTQNNTATNTTNNTNNQNNTGVADTTNTDQNTQNQVAGDTTQSTSDNDSNGFSNTSYSQNNDAAVYKLDPQTIRVLQTADVNPKDLTEVQLKEVRKLNFNDLDKDTSTQWTYDQYAGVAKKMIDQDAQYKMLRLVELLTIKAIN